MLQSHFSNNLIHKDNSLTDYGQATQGSHDGIWLGPYAFDPGHLANTLAHEEGHHWGWTDPGEPGYTGTAEDTTALGDSCAGQI